MGFSHLLDLFFPCYFLAAGSPDRQKGAERAQLHFGCLPPWQGEQDGEREVLGAALSPKFQFLCRSYPKLLLINVFPTRNKALKKKNKKNPTDFAPFSKFLEAEFSFIKGWNQSSGTKILLEDLATFWGIFHQGLLLNSPAEQRPWSWTAVPKAELLWLPKVAVTCLCPRLMAHRVGTVKIRGINEI